MSGKKGGGGGGKDNARAAKLVEDKTFGLKNKNKSKKVQQFVKGIERTVKDGLEKKAAAAKTPEQILKEQAKKMKADKERMEKELAALTKSSLKQPPLPEGVDPKSVLCVFFKAGVCDRGEKCKFGHDLTLSRKSAKASIYNEKPKEAESMEDWDQAKLEDVVKSKTNKGPTTDIVCQYFLDAIEKEQCVFIFEGTVTVSGTMRNNINLHPSLSHSLSHAIRRYGWFWLCPNGGDSCKYKHSLPPGFVYKSKKQRDAEAAAAAAEEVEDIVDQIEAARARLPAGGTPITAETFAIWKAKRDAVRAAAAAALAEEVLTSRAAGGGAAASKETRMLSGRALFTYDPSLFVDDAEAGAADEFEGSEEEEDDEDNGGAAVGGAPHDDDDDDDDDDEDGEGNFAEVDDEDEDEGDEEGGGDEEEEQLGGAAVQQSGGAAGGGCD